MQVIILEKNKETAESLKKAISIKFKCLIEESFNIKELELKYKGTNSVFIIDACIGTEKEINEEGLKIAHFINDKVKLRTLILGLREKENKFFLPYLKIPFLLEDLYNAISKTTIKKKGIDDKLILDKYELFRSKISHDYLQYSTKHWRFYKFLLSNFYKYTKLIFGFDIEGEKGFKKEKISQTIEKFENQKDPSILHSLMREHKLVEIRNVQLIPQFPELKEIFFKNLNILLEALDEKRKPPLDLGEKIAENFFLSWYLWRELFFIEKYNHYFSDGFYKGCFRILLSHGLTYYNDVKKDILQNICECSDINDSIKVIKSKINELREIFL